MLKRLIDERGMQGTDEKLADLLRAAAPFEADPFRKRRVLVRLSRVQARHAARFWLRPAIIATLLVSGTATAALGHRYVAHGSGVFGFGPAATSAAPHVPAQLTPAHTPLSARVGASSAPENSVAPSATPTDALEPPVNPVRPASKGNGHARPGSREDATHVVEAIQALRTARDPSRAQGLLNDYLKTHPHGALSEDALALSIEAASVQHDPRAADYARRYLVEFPHGRYRDLANRAVAQQR